MKKKRKEGSENSSRRNFIKKLGAGLGTVSLTGIGAGTVASSVRNTKSGEKVKLLSPEGKLVEVDKNDIKPAGPTTDELREEAKIGLAGRKFVMVIDLAKCKNARRCVEACQEGHMLPKVKLPKDHVYDPELNVPAVEGTVGKCIFCADNLRKNILPRCVTACPMGVIYFGDLHEDTITNGDETVRFSEVMRDRAGYRYREELGTLPSVFYLPPVQRMFPVERGLDGYDESIKGRYKKAGPR
jgi:Fe-S-cluster-containing dehydrogenase component